MVVGAQHADVDANEEQGAAYVFAGVACPAITLDPPTLPNGAAGSPYNLSVTATAPRAVQLLGLFRRTADWADTRSDDRFALRHADDGRNLRLHDHGDGRQPLPRQP